MTKDVIDSSLHARPFKPFSLRLPDASLVPVPHPEFMVLSQTGRTAVVNTVGDRYSIVDLGLVTAVEFDAQNGAS